MKKWMLSAIAYLLVVVGSYYAYNSIAGEPADEVDHTEMEQHDN
ncbi:hypothetical protein [Metabacillus idriensis]|nr:hypothetical protein [Metabacillus idriensis]